jgi:hypothetical protein
MIRRVCTNEISLDEWKMKVKESDDEWLLRQYYGLSFLVESLNREVDMAYENLQIEKGTVQDDVYKDYIYPLKSELMNVDIQLVDVEDEIDDRQIGLLGMG